MDNRGTARKRQKEAHHEINHVIGRKNTEVPNSLLKRNHLRDCMALLEVILMCRHAALGTAAGAGGIDDGSDVVTLARNEDRFTLFAEVFPPLGALHSCICRTFRTEDGFAIGVGT